MPLLFRSFPLPTHQGWLCPATSSGILTNNRMMSSFQKTKSFLTHWLYWASVTSVYSVILLLLWPFGLFNLRAHPLSLPLNIRGTQNFILLIKKYFPLSSHIEILLISSKLLALTTVWCFLNYFSTSDLTAEVHIHRYFSTFYCTSPTEIQRISLNTPLPLFPNSLS